MLKDGEDLGVAADGSASWEGYEAHAWGHPSLEWVKEAAVLLVSLPLDEAMGGMLEFAGTQAGACRAWIFRYNREGTHFSNTHEWIAPGVRSFVEDLQNTPVTMISWLQGLLLERRAVLVKDIARLPRAAGALKAEFIRQGNRNVFCVPLFGKDGRLVACIGFDAVRQHRHWGAEMAANLGACAELIALAWERHEEQHGVPEGGPLADSPAMVYLHQGAHVRGVPVSEIIGITAEKDYTRVHLPGGTSALELRPLKVWLDLLPKASFQKIHRGAIVNMGQVESVERATGGKWRVHLSGIDGAWSVSKAYRADVRSRLGV